MIFPLSPPQLVAKQWQFDPFVAVTIRVLLRLFQQFTLFLTVPVATADAAISPCITARTALTTQRPKVLPTNEVYLKNSIISINLTNFALLPLPPFLFIISLTCVDSLPFFLFSSFPLISSCGS